MKNRKKYIPVVIIMLAGFLCACGRKEPADTLLSDAGEGRGELLLAEDKEDKNIREHWEKGYDLLIEEEERKEAEADCRAALELTAEIYREADKGEASNVVLSEEVMAQMKEKIKTLGKPVTGSRLYSDMENWEEMERFLLDAGRGKAGTILLYMIHRDGGIGRLQYKYDGKNLYVLAANMTWGRDGTPMFTYISNTRIKEWWYTEKGYLGYELCVPEPPEVSEIIDGSCLVRVRPLSEECREMSENCVIPLGYQGNNLLCSNWDVENLEELDYNGAYEYFYGMKYDRRFEPEQYPDGIPAEEFEDTIMDYLPVSQEDLRAWAMFDEEHQSYPWERLGCGNYAPNFFGTSVPEVTQIRENGDGTFTLTVDAVCEMILCDDAVITHELTVRFSENGDIQYLGNRILDDGIFNIPEYQYRIGK